MRFHFFALAVASALSIASAPGIAAEVAAANTQAIIKKIDSAKSTLTLAHEPIENLAMPAMTMSFQMADSALLKGRKVGDKVKVRIEDIGGKLTVVRLIVTP